MAGYRRLPVAGGFMRSPARESDHSVQSCHQEPLCLVACERQASGPAEVYSPVSCQAFGPGGLTMPAMWPPLDSTYRTVQPSRPVALYDDGQGTMWALIAHTI